MKIINFPRALLFFVQLFQEAKENKQFHKSITRQKEKRNVSINASRFRIRLMGIIEFYFYCIMILILSCDIISKNKLKDKKMQCFINKWAIFSVCYPHSYDNSIRKKKVPCASRMINREEKGSNSTRK